MSTKKESSVDLKIFIEEDIDSGELITALVAKDEKLKNAVLQNNKVVIFYKHPLYYHLDNNRKNQC